MKFNFNSKYISVISTFIVCLMLYFYSGIKYDGFMSLQVFVNFLSDNAFLGIIAVGMTIVILSGGIDLSVGSILALTGVVIATLIEKYHFSPMAAFAVSLAIGVVLGTAMGCIIHFFNAPPFIVTLAGMFLARGIGQVISLESIPISNEWILQINSSGIPLTQDVTLPFIAVLFLIVFVIGFFLYQYTVFGRSAYAIGGNKNSAMLLGVSVGFTRIFVYTLSGFFAALGGIVYTIYTSAGYGLAGVGLELDVIAAVVIGGTLITGGVGYIAGTMIGVLILGIIQTFITFNGTLSSHWTRIVIGLLICIFILLQKFFMKIQSARTQ